MKRFAYVALLASITTLPSCLKDKITRTYIVFEPVYRTKSEVLNDIKSNQPLAITSPGKIYQYGSYIFLNDINKGVHIIDNSNPASPVQKAFINIPGNLDIAVKGSTLYADLYTDMVAVDISDPLHAALVKVLPKIFPERQYNNGFVADTSKVIVDWIKKKVTVPYEDQVNRGICSNCMLFMAGTQALAAAPAPAAGVGGSMARFAVVNNYLYAVNLYSLNIVDISNSINPVKIGTTSVGWNIETIYPFKQKLFIGSSAGMFVYDISSPSSPIKEGNFAHARACDPVVADDNYAYVTLRAGSICQGTNNELDVVNVTNMLSSTLVKSYPMTNPYGLAKDGNLLFVCDGKSGLKVFNAADVLNLQLVKWIPGFETYDVIAANKRLLLVAKDGLYQYDYSNPGNMYQLSKITVARN